jgi:hypothetical protein
LLREHVRVAFPGLWVKTVEEERENVSFRVFWRKKRMEEGREAGEDVEGGKEGGKG